MELFLTKDNVLVLSSKDISKDVEFVSLLKDKVIYWNTVLLSFASVRSISIFIIIKKHLLYISFEF